MTRNSAISNLSDNELLLLHKKSRKKIYLGELFVRYLPLLYGVCLKYLKDSRFAQDAVIHIFEELLGKIANYRINDFRSWIYGFTKNYCLQIAQKKELPVAQPHNDTDDIEEYNDAVVLSDEDEQDEQQTALLVDCLNELPEEQRASLIYFFVDELSFAEIANKTGFPLKHIKNHIQNGKQNLKTYLSKNI